MDLNQSTGNKVPSQEHINFINKLNDAKIPRQSHLIANRLFMKNFPRETTSAEIENYFQSFGAVHDVKIIAKENTHFAFISFINENTALDVLRQHALVPLTFQNHAIILAPAYKKPSALTATSPTFNYSTNGSAMTPPSTPSRTAVNGVSQQASTPYHQQALSAPHTLYPPIFFPVQAANMPFVPMTGTYILPQGPTPPHHPQMPSSFYPTFYTQTPTHQASGHIINGHAYVPPPYVYSMGPPPIPAQYPSAAAVNDVSITSEY